MHTFHLPMPDELHEALRAEATAARRPATEIVRDALAGWLLVRKRQRIAAEIEAFALAEAGGPLDLDRELETAAIAHLLARTAP